MRGLMMDRPLLISSLLEHAGSNYHDQEIVSRTTEGEIHRYTWRLKTMLGTHQTKHRR